MISIRRRAFSLSMVSLSPACVAGHHCSFFHSKTTNIPHYMYAVDTLRPHFSSPFHRTSSSPAFVRCLGASLRHICHTSLSRESALTDTSISRELKLTDTRKAAFGVGKGAELLAFYADHHVVNLPQGHRFPMDKYRATRLMLEDDATLVKLLITRPSPAASIAELCLVHEERYVKNIFNGDLDEKEQRNLGFPWSSELVNRSCASIGGTIAAMHSVMLGLRRVAANVAGGTHHAFPDHGEGFCEGNGTAKIFEKDNRVITFSIHGANNYPWRTKMKSDYDVDLPDDTDDKSYLAVLADWLERLFRSHNPSLIFFQAGVDALREDSFGRLAMTRQGLLQRNNMVYTACLTRDLPLVITMGGGYSRPAEASVLAHADVYRAAALRYGALSRTS